ncbi:MAG: Fic family protein [Gammaproteobacteria bacterium]|nr:Fic family protein [Gammaproteobacteria bacterium]
MDTLLLTSREHDLLEVICRFPQGIGIELLLHQLQKPVTRRTLQRLLRGLVQKKQVAVFGKGPATLYKPIEEPDFSIPIAPDGRDILTYIQQPLFKRQPTSYDRDFLGAYEPNRTYYLGETTRTMLRRMGDTGKMVRPAGTYAHLVLNHLLIDLSWSSSRLEGNTYSRLDTQQLIEFGREAAGKNAQEVQMILNHKAAILLLVDSIDDVGFDLHTFLSLQGLLSENLLADPEASGRLRKRPIEIAGSVYRPLALPQVIEEVFREVLFKANTIQDPFEQAFFILVHIPYLQPFEDVNKRVSRLGANISFLKHNLCPLTFIGVPNSFYIDAVLAVYEMTRIELLRDLFVWAYERSTREYLAVQKSLVEPDPLRLHYREHIHELVRRIVQNCKIESMEDIQEYAKAHLPAQDQERFIEVVLDDLKRLHEGVLARYKIKPIEWLRWQNVMGRNRPTSI